MYGKKLIIGLTGGIGSGKTAASDYFHSLGICVVDADIEARAVVEPDSPTLAAIADYFGPDTLSVDGSLNRAWLREEIFQHPHKRQWLESVTHPAIRERITQQLARSDSVYTILVSPLLFESGQDKLTDRVLLIDLPEAMQVERASQRDNSAAGQIESIIQAQMPRQMRREKADDIIINDKSPEALKAACLQLHHNYVSQAKALSLMS